MGTLFAPPLAVAFAAELVVVVVAVFVQVLFVMDSPIEGRPWLELECCGPWVVLVNERPVLEFQRRFIADQTWERGEGCGEKKKRR